MIWRRYAYQYFVKPVRRKQRYLVNTEVSYSFKNPFFAYIIIFLIRKFVRVVTCRLPYCHHITTVRLNQLTMSYIFFLTFVCNDLKLSQAFIYLSLIDSINRTYKFVLSDVSESLCILYLSYINILYPVL